MCTAEGKPEPRRRTRKTKAREEADAEEQKKNRATAAPEVTTVEGSRVERLLERIAGTLERMERRWKEEYTERRLLLELVALQGEPSSYRELPLWRDGGYPSDEESPSEVDEEIDSDDVEEV